VGGKEKGNECQPRKTKTWTDLKKQNEERRDGQKIQTVQGVGG